MVSHFGYYVDELGLRACGCAGDGGCGVVGACEVWVRAWFGGGADDVIWFGLVRGAMNGLG